jgi:hypothetical protein
MVSSSRDFGVEQFFRADEFRAVDPSPRKRLTISFKINVRIGKLIVAKEI